MKQFQIYQKGRIKSLKVSYNEHEKLMVDDMRLSTISFLSDCENCTVNETHEHTINEMREKITSLIADLENSSVKEKKGELSFKLAPLISARNSCIRLHDELLHLHVARQKVMGRPELSFIASKICEDKIQQFETYLNEKFPNFSNHMFTAKRQSAHYVKIPSESNLCWISAICVLPGGQVLLLDACNWTVKLLNQQYQVVNHLAVGKVPKDICQITSSEVAVAVDDAWFRQKVQFITVSTAQLLRGKKFQLQHKIRSIAHHQGDLYISSGSALYKYSLKGELVCSLWEAGDTELRCAVSPTGDKLYITNSYHEKLLTLAKDGTVLATFSDPVLKGRLGVHVTPSGQVLVFGPDFYSIIQLDSEGRRKLATLATKENVGLWGCESVCYSSTTSSIIVGLVGGFILVIRVE
ncbi:hypothetical protein DPMN_153868 [Dreissena polymorpha]|uniref:Uncharacterized protein n=1 Tax=Dreissena polymorpha TaxID=45954 RepID=A0A9D4FQQ0_DREPO|nr:hypothetical protein DPMN_153868 [Dreissena polymorpha]